MFCLQASLAANPLPFEIKSYQSPRGVVGSNLRTQGIIEGDYYHQDFNIAFTYLEVPAQSELANFLSQFRVGRENFSSLIVSVDELSPILEDEVNRLKISQILSKQADPFRALGALNQNLRGSYFSQRNNSDRRPIWLPNAGN